jgi:alkylation response protein AidB-like acyl-CoA dehydrogenase
MGMMVPSEFGGSGADTVSYVLALSEVAYACAATAVVMSVHNSIVCESLNTYGTVAQKEKFLKPLAAGAMIGAFALTEPNAGSDPSRQTTKAVRDGNSYLLNGTKRFTTTGKNAGLIIITAKTDESRAHRGISAFLVEQGTKGLKAGPLEDKMGLRASDTCDLILDDCRIPADQLLGNEGDGFLVAMTGLDCGRIGIAAQSVGVARAALDAAVNYTQQREQFGQRSPSSRASAG